MQETNCHPFAHGRWLFVHNGVVNGFPQMRRDLMLAIAPELFSGVLGSTDSEVLFHLALTFGLDADPIEAVERTIGLVEETGRRHRIDFPFQGSIGVSDGETLWAFRYSSEGRSRSLFISGDVHALRALHPENPRIQQMRDEDRLIVSEPLADLPGAWHEIPEATAVTIRAGGVVEQQAFAPHGAVAA